MIFTHAYGRTKDATVRKSRRKLRQTVAVVVVDVIDVIDVVVNAIDVVVSVSVKKGRGSCGK